MGFLPGLQEHTKGSVGCVFHDSHPIFPLSFMPLVPVIYLSLSPKKSFSLLGHLLRMCISPSPPSDSFRPGADALPRDTDSGRPVPSMGRILPWPLSVLIWDKGQEWGRGSLKGLLL
uniref:Uncharacterized protein n=1 Tax=Buteo japonicus TaxID=224669 RepID=A0A8C0ALY5_9AVES